MKDIEELKETLELTSRTIESMFRQIYETYGVEVAIGITPVVIGGESIPSDYTVKVYAKISS